MATSTFRGLAFPYQKGKSSFPEATTDADLVKQSIIQILLTEYGERVMRPNFGSGVTSKVFENNDELFASLLQAEVLEAIGRWEPRALVTGVLVERQDSTVIVTVNFVYAPTQQQTSIDLQLNVPV